MAASNKKLVLRIRRVSDEFVISESGAALSATLKKMMLVADDGVIDLSNIVHSPTVPMIVDYLETHAAAAGLSEEEKMNFDKEFASGEKLDFLNGLVLDAYTLKIEGLIDLLAEKLGDIIRPKLESLSPEQLREELKRVHTPEVEQKGEQFRRRYPNFDWAAEDERRRHRREQTKQANIQ